MTSAQRFVHERETVFRRLVNAGGPRTEQMMIRLTPRTRERLRQMAAHWQSTASGVAGELLEALVGEVWEAFEAREEVPG